MLLGYIQRPCHNLPVLKRTSDTTMNKHSHEHQHSGSHADTSTRSMPPPAGSRTAIGACGSWR